MRPLPVRFCGSYTTAPAIARPKPLEPTIGIGTVFAVSVASESPSPSERKFTRFVQLNRPPDIEDAGRAENADAITVCRKRAPRLDLADAHLFDFGVVDIIGAAEPCSEYGYGGEQDAG